MKGNGTFISFGGEPQSVSSFFDDLRSLESLLVSLPESTVKELVPEAMLLLLKQSNSCKLVSTWPQTFKRYCLDRAIPASGNLGMTCLVITTTLASLASVPHSHTTQTACPR